MTVSIAYGERELKEGLSNKEKFLMFGLGNDVDKDSMRTSGERKEKSLLNTFPFIDHINTEHGDAHTHEHHLHHGAHGGHPGNEARNQLPVRNQFATRPSANVNSQRNSLFPFKSFLRQNDGDDEEGEEGSGFISEENNIEEDTDEITSIDFNTVAEAAADDEDAGNGRKCLDKVIMTEETVYDEVITCDHSYDKRCHTSYVTNYESQQEQECEEHYKKSCYINYEPLAYNETVEVCRTPVVKDCAKEGTPICQTVYESECWTRQNVHEVSEEAPHKVMKKMMIYPCRLKMT